MRERLKAVRRLNTRTIIDKIEVWKIVLLYIKYK